MGSFYHYLHEYPLLALAQSGFTIWMLVDANRRRAEQYWFWVILFFQPLGSWAYFLTHKLGDFSVAGGWSLFHRRPSLDELRYQVQQTPTLTSYLALAERLVETGEHEEAAKYLELALAREPDHCQVLYLLAVSHAELGRPGQAIPLLERIIQRDRAWSDYSAWRLLVEARSQADDRPGALAACRELVRLSPTLRHRCLLAEHLLDAGHAVEARELLEQSLVDHRYAPAPLRRRNRSWASEARRLQKRALGAS